MSLASVRRPGVLIPSALSLAFVLVLLLSGRTSEPHHPTVFRQPSAPLKVIGDRAAADLTLATARAFYRRAPLAVVAAPDDATARSLASSAAARLHAPVLLVGHGMGAELARLGVQRVLAIGDVGDSTADLKRTDAAANHTAVDKAVTTVTTVKGSDLYITPTPRHSDAIVVTRSTSSDAVALTNARNAGATILQLPGADPRRDPKAASLLRNRRESPVVALGEAFTHGFSYTLDAVRKAPSQPGGGYLVFPGRTMVALYGHPGSASLGVLGERGVNASIARAKRTAKQYQRFSSAPVVPTFEIIATVASASPGKDHDYSSEASLSLLRPWVERATKAGMYVVLDLQSGRSDFLSQAKRYESLLARPHVGLALDPEWRLKKNQKPLHQIGSVDIAEINRTANWLADLTRRHSLPQKLLILHQFQNRMINGRSRLDTTHPELSILIHVDGQGTQPEKQGTWKAIHSGAPKGVFWGWKNFYDEDKPTLSIAKTWAEVKPTPEFISYQ